MICWLVSVRKKQENAEDELVMSQIREAAIGSNSMLHSHIIHGELDSRQHQATGSLLWPRDVSSLNIQTLCPPIFYGAEHRYVRLGTLEWILLFVQLQTTGIQGAASPSLAVRRSIRSGAKT